MASMSMSLHAVNHRLTNIPVKQLPPIASCLATSLSNCGELLSAPQNQKSKSESDNAVQVHKLLTRLASLLQDKSPEGRWTAVVLVKAVVEAGQWEILRGCEPLVRGLIAILAKPDPNSTKKLSIITLTRIFHLTYQYPTLVREITTPSLPSFITSALNLISVKPSSEPIRKLKPHSPFLETVLNALGELIARHPTIFRPFSAQIHSILQAIIGSTSPTFPQTALDSAERLFISLHHCAPKNTSGEEWKNACQMTIASIHGAADYVFRAVVEQWESVDPALRQASRPQDYSMEVSDGGLDTLGLAGWQGLDSGVNRLVVLLQMLSTCLTTATASMVAIPIGPILDLTSRLTAVVIPSDGRDVQANPQISRTEREHLFAELPRIHVGCMELLQTLVKILETGAIPVIQTILEQTLWVYRAEKFSREIRVSAYDLVQTLLTRMGPSLTKQSLASLADLIRTSCHDLLPPAHDQSASARASSDAKGKAKSNHATANADSFLNPMLKQGRQSNISSFSSLTRAASELLAGVLTHAPTEYLSPSLRAEIDRTIILTSDKHTMLASVLNPVPAVKGRGVSASIMPFLARSFPAEMEVEGLIRPRMPVLMNAPGVGGYTDMEEDEEEEEDVPAPVSGAAPESTGFLQPSSTPILHHDMMDTDVSHKTVPALTKRSLAEDSKLQPPALGSTGKVDSNVQSKRPRVEGDVSAVASQPSLDRASPTTFTGTAAVSVPSSSATVTSAPPPRVASVNAPSTTTVGGPLSGSAVAQTTSTDAREDDSDDDLPALNIDPDTDDEDEDEDETMEG
ncbi:rRNA processing/ribosome biogenesis-domain-containing protein [Aspergillus pseudotamarii]|uniref:Pre-rRNA-processing protein RIX1 n=1 Tax=Aspergillus pseudotamarii TaxID=132259 RepID=A0A5N6T7B5_ASPPS|nr:rRNA processing/ribosome biogenesis-domain-containing protein [Aspergillus pseudotamarii]KAE8142223.1 rRNA processing/ribosome biogenesis-domain-containing protein [Aspergillus pseudotamarii]